MRILAGAPSYQNGPRLTPPSTRFSTIVGLPKTIALQFATGRAVKSRLNGDMQMMYTLTSGEKAYFPLNVGEAIDSLTLAPGQPFTVCHHGGGNWDIERAEVPAYNPPKPFPQQPPPVPPRPPLPPAAQAPVNGGGEDTAAILTRCYLSAIAITLTALETARTQGLQVLPSHEGLQACAATLFIAETRRQL